MPRREVLTGHCVPRRIATQLIAAGHEVVLLRDCLPVDAADPVVLQKAAELDAVLLSLNGDFADITAYPPFGHRGIVALQLHNRPEAIAPSMQRLIGFLNRQPERGDWVGKLFLVESHRIRVRT